MTGHSKVTVKNDPRPRKDYCKDMLLLKRTTGYYKETLYKRGTMWLNRPKPVKKCTLFGGSWTIYTPHLFLREYSAKLIGDSDLINQILTKDSLYVTKNLSVPIQYHYPSDEPNDLILWETKHTLAHDFIDIKPISAQVTIQKLENYIHIPSLEIGGEISFNHPLSDKNGQWYTLDNGILVEGNGSRFDYRRASFKKIVFL
eukprot:TCONS_00040050-protein